MGFLSRLFRFLLGSNEPRAPRPRRRRPVTFTPPPSAPSPPPPTPRSPAPDLDPGDFAPMSRAEILRAKAPSASSTALGWTRFDRIPPAGDAHNELVDRAMVSHGFITPEELVEIHEVGREMDEVRPAHHSRAARAHAAAQASARARKEERERVKAEKQAAAREKRERRAQEVAERKRTEIDFLGRGVSKGLADRRANVEKLEANGLKILATAKDLADVLGLTIPRLRWLAFHQEAARVTHYVRFTVPKKRGGTRELAAPMPRLAEVQHAILTGILAGLPLEEPAHGFVPGRSTVTNATPHVGASVVVNFDLKDFFPSVTFPRVRGLFQSLGYSPAVATIFALLTTECPRREVEYAGQRYHVATGPRALPQGACTSPALSNLIARGLDRRLAGLAAKLGWTYTRYADDITLSTKDADAVSLGRLMARVRHTAEDEGFTVNEKKTRVLRRNASQRVTGIVVNDRPNVPRKTVRRLRAILHRARFEGLDAQNRDGLPHFRAWLLGMIAYVSMVNPDRGRELRDAYRRVESR